MIVIAWSILLVALVAGMLAVLATGSLNALAPVPVRSASRRLKGERRR